MSGLYCRLCGHDYPCGIPEHEQAFAVHDPDEPEYDPSWEEPAWAFEE